MTRTRLSTPLLVVASGLCACGGAAAHTVAPATGAPVSVAIPGADRFTPSVVDTADPGRVVFTNRDTDAHTVTSTPGDPVAFNLQLKPGQTATLVLDRPGTYRYYCALHARYDAGTGQIASLPMADDPAEPMAGVIVVPGA